MIKPFYQGKLDTFCAIYAVLNAYRLLYGIRTLKARDILNESLLELAADRKRFAEVLNQETDYVALVDHMLDKYAPKLSYAYIKPFAPGQKVSHDELWTSFRDWLGEYPNVNKSHTVVFRFMKYLSPGKSPLNKHWTTGEYVKDDYIHLFDSSHEAEAILNVNRNAFVIEEKDLDSSRLIRIPPDSIRFLTLK